MITTEHATRKDVRDTTTGITLSEYKRAGAELRVEERRVGVFAHAIIYVLMNTLLMVINLLPGVAAFASRLSCSTERPIRIRREAARH